MSKLDELRARAHSLPTTGGNAQTGVAIREPFRLEAQADIAAEKFVNGFVEFQRAAVVHNFEVSPRETLIRLLKEKNVDQAFTFNVPRDTAHNYIGAMRAVLSRSRRKAAKRKQRLQDFKLMIISIEHETDHDIVTIMRTQTKQQRVLSVYDEVLDSITLGPFGARKP